MYYNITESGRRIKNLRKSRGLTQEAFADKVGLSYRSIADIERGYRGTSIDALIVINMLISLMITGKYEIVVVNKMKDLTDDLSDLNEFMKDTFAIGVHFFELSTMQFHFQAYSDKGYGKERPNLGWRIGVLI